MADCYDSFCKNKNCNHERRQHSRCGCTEGKCTCSKTYMEVGEENRKDKGRRDRFDRG